MRNNFSKYQYQIYLIFIGLIWITFLHELMQVGSQDFIFPDSDNYRESADFLYHNFKAHYFRPLGVAFISGLPYLVGFSDAAIYQFSFIINLLCWLGSALLLFSLIKRSLPQKQAFVFALLFYSCIGSAYITFHLLTETIFTFLIIVTFYFIEKYYQSKSFHYLSVALSILLFTMLIKPGIKFFAIIFVILFVKQIIKNYKKSSAILLYLTIILIGVQCIKMKNEYGNYTITYIDGVTYYNYLGNKAMLYTTNDTLVPRNNKRAQYLERLSFKNQKTVAANDMANQVKHNKINLIKAYISDISINTKSPSASVMICKNVKDKSYFMVAKHWLVVISKYQNRIFTIAGFILALYFLYKHYKSRVFYKLPGLFILYIIATSGISCNEGDRFHIVFFPFVIILIAKVYAERKSAAKIII